MVKKAKYQFLQALAFDSYSLPCRQKDRRIKITKMLNQREPIKRTLLSIDVSIIYDTSISIDVYCILRQPTSGYTHPFLFPLNIHSKDNHRMAFFAENRKQNFHAAPAV